MARFKHVFDNDKGYRAFKRELQKAPNVAVVVGIQEGDDNAEGTAIAEYAAYNEFGTRRIPERSFMRSTFDERQDQLLSMMRRQYDLMKTSGRTAHQALGYLGEFHQRQIQTKIRNLKIPPNAASTIAKKKSDNPLIDSGAMIRAVRYVFVRR